MWTTEAVDRMLSNYVSSKARAAHLQVEIDKLRAEIADTQRILNADVSNLGAQAITGMPRGNGTGDPTARIAIRMAENEKSTQVKSMLAELSAMKKERRDCCRAVKFVDAWLMALNEREKWLIVKQVIHGERWQDVIVDYAKAYHANVSQDTLSRIKLQAMIKIYAAAGIC